MESADPVLLLPLLSCSSSYSFPDVEPCVAVRDDRRAASVTHYGYGYRRGTVTQFDARNAREAAARSADASEASEAESAERSRRGR